MDNRNLKLVIAGDVDSGKSTLIGRILYDMNLLSLDKLKEIKKIPKEYRFAFLLDSFKEEREEKRTLDTTYGFLKSRKRKYMIIDIPGHKEFITNMISGSSFADLAVLIIDVTKGITEQTERHILLLDFLGIGHLIIAVNKMDAINYKAEKFIFFKEKANNFLKSVNLTPPISYIPLSALEGENVTKNSDRMLWFRGKNLISTLDFVKKVSSKSEFSIFSVQDIYEIDSRKIVVGKVESGVIRKNDRVKILQKNEKATIKSIEVFKSKKDKAFKQEAVGITLKENISVKRGDIICSIYKEPELSSLFKADILLIGKSLTESEKIMLKCSTQEVCCIIKKIYRKMDSSNFKVLEENASGINHLEIGEVLIQTEEPLLVFPFEELPELGRFVLSKDNEIISIGTVRKS